MQEHFDEHEGVWVRQFTFVDGRVCGWCVAEFERGGAVPVKPTMRLDIKSPEQRLAVAQAWAEAHPERVITRRYLGGYEREERLAAPV